MKLTAAEKKWILDLQALLATCPSKRLGFYTIGDPAVEIYDFTKEAEVNKVLDSSNSDFGNAVDKAGAYLPYSLRFPNCVHSVAG